MPGINIELSAGDAREIQSRVDRMNQHDHLERGTRPGEMTKRKLITVLTGDVAWIESRPGSWEGANRADVVQSHGYSETWLRKHQT